MADLHPYIPLKTVPTGDIYSAARAGDLDRRCFHIDAGVNVNARDRWDPTHLYYACLAGHFEVARMLLKVGAICSERTFDGDRCHYAALMADLHPHILLKTVPTSDIYSAARAGDLDRLCFHIDAGVNVNTRDRWDSAALYYACLAGHVEATRMLLKAGAIFSEHTFDGDRCHYAALNLRVRRLLKVFEARPPPLSPLPAALRDTFLGCAANRRAYLEQCEEGAAIDQ